MSAVERGRQKAAELHTQALAAGVDPFDSLALVLWVASKIPVQTEDLAPGAAAFQGGQALYDPTHKTIFYPNIQDRFFAAFLVAHEIGHVCLGDASQMDKVVEVDPERAAEAAPVGEDRVIDYSRRSRREVQMDIFARELILPRERARHYHLEDKLSATALAQKLGASFGVVAQQLFDALLLPPVVFKDEARPQKPLNDVQRRAAEHTVGPLVLEAGPGTGKTQTLAARVRVLIERKVDPRNILILTFSNKAAGELADRIGTQSDEASVAAWVGTFHGFGLDLIKRHYDRLGFTREPSLMDRPQAIDLLEAEAARLGLEHFKDLWDPTENLRALLNAISRAQDEVKGPEDYTRCAESMRARDPDGCAKALEVARVYARYQEIKRERQAVDFGDLVTLPIKLLTEHPDVRASLQDTYRHILVDEYQDVNRSSVALLELLLGAERNLWVVGDARQAIYRFRGASSFNMARFGHQDFAPATRMRLAINYRSHKEIVDAFGDFGRDMAVGDGDGRLGSERGPSGHNPVHQIVGTKLEEGAGAVAAIQAMREQGYAFRQQAVLCKGNDRLARMGEELERRGIPVLFLGSLFERPEIKDLLSWLTLAVDNRAMGLVRHKSTTADLNLNLADATAVMAELKTTDAKVLDWRTRPFAAVGPAGRKSLTKIAAIYAGVTPEMAPWQLLAHLMLDSTRLVADLANDASVPARAKSAAVWQFMNFIRTPLPGQGLLIRRLLNRIRRLVRLADDRELRQLPEAAQSIDAVRLMTIHGSKGLEFDVVHVLGLNKGSFPHSGAPPKCLPPDGLIVGTNLSGEDFVQASATEEQECLFYVALSRAKDRLLLHSVARQAGARGTPRAPSDYLSRITNLVTKTLDLSAEVLEDEDSAPLAVQFVAPFAVSLTQFEQYGRCPRRFLYTHVLEVGGKRRSNRFTAMHEVVQKTIDRLMADGPATDAAQIFDQHWSSSPLAKDEAGGDYRVIGLGLVDAFLLSREGRAGTATVDMAYATGNGTLQLRPHEVLEGPSGPVARRIRTGKRPSEKSRDGEELFLMLVRHSGQAAEVEFIYLSDGHTPFRITPKPAALAKKGEILTRGLGDIAAGLFPMKESERTCPDCPAFFVCGPVGAGTLEKKLETRFPDSQG